MRFSIVQRALAVTMEPYMQRANLTDEKIKILSEQIAKLKQKGLAGAIEKEEQRLQLINENLKKQVDDLKTRLTIAEIENGKTIYMVPPRTATMEVPNIAEKPKPETTAPPAEKSATNNAKKAKTEKPKKAAQQKSNADDAVDVSRLDLRIGRIVTATRHPDADTLYVEDVETGEEKNRTVLSGLVNNIPIEEMQNRLVILMMNLKPVKMRGIFSQAMVMCASSPEKVEILLPPPGCVPGDRVTFAGYPGEPDAQLNPKKKVWERIQPDLRTDANKVACYKGVPFTIEGKGVCTAPTMANSSIK